MENIWKERTKKVKDEIADCKRQREIDSCTTQIQNCLDLLIPSPDNFLHSDEQTTNQNLEATQNGNFKQINRENGITTRNIKISLTASNENSILAQKTLPISGDNCDVIENLRDQYTVLKNKLLPKVRKWTITLSKARNSEATDLLKQVIDIKVVLEKLESKVEELNIVKKKTNTSNKCSQSDTDESDFEEVPEKEGYEHFSSYIEDRNDTSVSLKPSTSSR